MNGLWMQCKAEVIRMLRNPYYIFWSLCMPIIFYIIFTQIFNTNTDNQEGWKAHYLMSMTTFSVMGSAIISLGIRNVEERTQGWSMIMKITPLSTSAYFFAKMVGQTVIHIFSITVIFIAGVMNGVTLTAFEWIMSGLWILIASAPFLALGTLLGTMKKVETAAGVSNLLYMLLAILGGMWMPLEAMPKMIQNIGQWLPSYNFGNGVWSIVRGDFPDVMNIVILFGYFVVFVLLSSYIRKRQEAAV